MAAGKRASDRRKVSILIASRNAKADLPRLFASLRRITYPKSLYEVVFVDDGSTDDSWKIAEKFGARVFRFEERQGRARARNKALQMARHPVVAWIDSDCEIADPRWIENMMKHLDGKVVGVAGNQLKPRGDLPRVLYYMPGTAYTADRAGEASHAPTTSSLFLKKPLIDAGGYDPEMITAEDLEMCWRLRRKGYRFVKTEEAAIYHNFRATMSGFARQQYERGVFGAYLLRKYGRGGVWSLMDRAVYALPFAGIAVLLWPGLLWTAALAPLFVNFGLSRLSFFPSILARYALKEGSVVGCFKMVAAEYVYTFCNLMGLLSYQIRNLRD
jgi:glycosyltransferase involved in cell wall biosynthesis